MASPRLARRNGAKAAIREENEKAILAAAEEVFADYGLAGATTSRIAEAAGIPKANLHYYFPTKEVLYRRSSVAAVLTTIATLLLVGCDAVRVGSDRGAPPGRLSSAMTEFNARRAGRFAGRGLILP